MAEVRPTTFMKFRARDAFVFALHQFAGTWGIALLAYFLGSSLFELIELFGRTYSMRPLHWILTETPYFPVQIILGLYTGWRLGRSLKHRAMLWVWIVPGLLLCYAVAHLWLGSQPRSILSESPISHYFGWGCQPKYGCLDQLLITMPFYAGSAYSVGAWIALRLVSTE